MGLKTYGRWEVGGAELRVKRKIMGAIAGEPAGAVGIVLLESLIHVCNQENATDAFRRLIGEALEETTAQVRRTLRP